MILFYKISLFNIKKIESLYKLSLCISVRGCGQVDKNDLDHIICKVRVITRLKDLNGPTVVNTLEVKAAVTAVSFLLASLKTNIMYQKLKYLDMTTKQWSL